MVICATLLGPLLAGCSHDKSADFDNMSKADQEKAMHPDPAVMKEMAEKYGHQGPPSGAPAAGTPAAPR